MGDLQAAVGRVQLRKLDHNNDRRRAIAHRLNDGLRTIPGIRVQDERPYAPHIYHLYSFFYDPQVVGASKDQFIRYLEEVEGIQIVVRFFPVHLLAEFRALGHRYGDCPVAEKLYFEHQMQLPIYTHLTDEQIEHMIQGIRRAVEKLSA